MDHASIINFLSNEDTQEQAPGFFIAAQELNRNWIGIDKSEQAIKITRKRLNKSEKDLFSDYKYSYLEERNNFELKTSNEKKIVKRAASHDKSVMCAPASLGTGPSPRDSTGQVLPRPGKPENARGSVS
jgi:hypothetical protein